MCILMLFVYVCIYVFFDVIVKLYKLGVFEKLFLMFEFWFFEMVF